MKEKCIIIDDKINVNEQIETNRNHIDVFNSSGEHIMRSFNVVVDQGRAYTLLTLMNMTHVGDFAQIGRAYDPTQYLSVWGCGDGAASVVDPLNPSTPEFNSVELSNPVSFLTPDYTESPLEELPYWDLNLKKNFSSAEQKFTPGGKMYIELHLSIEPDECKGSPINEIGLYLASHGGSPAKDNFKLFSKVTFPSLPNAIGGGDSYSIIYRVYA